MNDIVNENVDVIRIDGRTFVFVGTAHVSRESAELADEVIRQYRPDTVCLELCEARFAAVTDEDRWKNTDIVEVIRSGKMYVLIAQLTLASFQKKLAEKFGIRPGEEMRRALSTGQEIGSKIAVVDRDVKITLRRAWSKASPWAMIKIVFSMLGTASAEKEISADEIEKLKMGDALAEVMAEFGEYLPGVKDALIDERDVYMAEKIRRVSGNTVVAVLGAGHIPGLKRVFGQEVDLAELEQIPPHTLSFKILSWGIPTLILVAMVFGFAFSGVETSMEMVIAWVLASGSLAAIGALISLAHPLTILSAFVAAPITTLNPTIAAGTVCALVEAWLRKPRVSDFESIADDISSLSGLWGNRLGRIILVFFLSSLGSAAGAFLGASWILSILAKAP